MSEHAFPFAKSDDGAGCLARDARAASPKRGREQQAQRMGVGPSKYELQGPTV